MKKSSLILSFVILLFACNQKRAEPVNSITDTSSVIVTPHDSVKTNADTHYFWESSFEDNTNRMVMKRVRPISIDSLTQANIIGVINDQYADIKIRFVKTSGDTIIVKVNNSDLLAKQMGSSGAEVYMAEVTYNLTELPNVNYVCFVFKQGDHATPGTYSRTDFIHPVE